MHTRAKVWAQIRAGSGTRAAAHLGLAAIAVLALSVPPLAWSQEKTAADACGDVLQENFGAVDVNVTRDNNARKHNSTYADAKRADGSTIRFRCLQSSTGVPKVEVFEKPKFGGANPGGKWSDADAYRVEASAKPDDKEKPAEPAAAPEQTPPEQTPPEPEGPQRKSAP